MLTRMLAVATALLLALVVNQYSKIGQLRAEVVAARQRADVDARAAVADWMEGQGHEIRRAMTWLDAYYKSPDGLQRPEGLWLNGKPDFEGISTWIFEVYMRHRLKGKTEDQARQAVEDAIKGSDEWRAKHRAQTSLAMPPSVSSP